MDRRTVLSRLRDQLQQQVALAEYTESITNLAQLKRCWLDAVRLVDTPLPSRDDIQDLAIRLRATALQPSPLSGQVTLRIAASYSWLARQGNLAVSP